MSEKLPPSWTVAPLSAVAKLQLGKMLDKARNTGTLTLPYLRNINVRWGSFDLDDLFSMRFTPDEAQKFLIRDGDVMVCEGGEPGRAAVWRHGCTDIVFQKAIHRIRPHKLLLPDWVAFFLRYSAESGTLQDHFTGTTIKHLPGQALAAIEIPLPPLPEQRRIVAGIEALFARTRRARTDLERIAPLAKRHRDQTLACATKGDWAEVAVADLANSAFDGPFGSNLKSADYTETGTRVVRLENIGHLRFIAEKETYISDQKAASLVRHNLEPGDVLFSSFVDKEVRVCVLPNDLPTAAINKADCFCLRVDGQRADPTFLTFRLAAPVTYENMRDAVHGATRPRIGIGDLKRYRIGLPPLAEQTRIVKDVNRAHRATALLEREATRALALLDRLEQSILTRAFRGELVPQDPRDGPASALLAPLGQGRGQPARRRARAAAG